MTEVSLAPSTANVILNIEEVGLFVFKTDAEGSLVVPVEELMTLINGLGKIESTDSVRKHLIKVDGSLDVNEVLSYIQTTKMLSH